MYWYINVYIADMILTNLYCGKRRHYIWLFGVNRRSAPWLSSTMAVTSRTKNNPTSNKQQDEGLLRLCKLLLEIFPYFIYEDWVRNKDIPVALNKHTEFCEWLFSLSKDPRSLLHICKSKIFKCLGKFACLKVDKLPLPKMLIESLKYNHHFHERMYKPITLETDECPFDCSPRCRRHNCPRGVASFD